LKHAAKVVFRREKLDYLIWDNYLDLQSRLNLLSDFNSELTTTRIANTVEMIIYFGHESSLAWKYMDLLTLGYFKVISLEL
jgi:hypothetical protein